LHYPPFYPPSVFYSSLTEEPIQSKKIIFFGTGMIVPSFDQVGEIYKDYFLAVLVKFRFDPKMQI
jgi:hypothetical protein